MTTASSHFISDSFQISFYAGITIQNILYGVELALYVRTMGILLGNRGMRKKSDLFFAVFSSIMVILITTWVTTSAVFGRKIWLVEDDYPGGPNMYWIENVSVYRDWYMDWSMTAIVLLQLMTDCLMIYRCWVVWDNYGVIVFPIILWVSSLVLGVLVDWTSSSPGGNFFTGLSSQLALAYYSVSVFLNTSLTCLICYRLVRHGRKVEKCLGYEYASSYFAVVTLVVESVLPCTLSGIAFLVSLGVGSPTSVAFISVHFLMMCISPQVLILCVIVGRAWERDTPRRSSGCSTVKFSPGTMTESQWIDSNRARVDLQTWSHIRLSNGGGKVTISPV